MIRKAPLQNQLTVKSVIAAKLCSNLSNCRPRRSQRGLMALVSRLLCLLSLKWTRAYALEKYIIVFVLRKKNDDSLDPKSKEKIKRYTVYCFFSLSHLSRPCEMIRLHQICNPTGALSTMRSFSSVTWDILSKYQTWSWEGVAFFGQPLQTYQHRSAQSCNWFTRAFGLGYQYILQRDSCGLVRFWGYK